MKSILVLVVIGAAITACSIPNMNDIHLSDCNEQCNTDSRNCFTGVDDAGTVCLDQDAGAEAGYNEQEAMRQACGEAQTKAGEACVNTLITCIDQCIKQTEDTLKGK